jgi:hypothetical protein
MSGLPTVVSEIGTMAEASSTVIRQNRIVPLESGMLRPSGPMPLTPQAIMV